MTKIFVCKSSERTSVTTREYARQHVILSTYNTETSSCQNEFSRFVCFDDSFILFNFHELTNKILD